MGRGKHRTRLGRLRTTVAALGVVAVAGGLAATGTGTAEATLTGGSGGAFTNRLNQSFSANGITSNYHIFAAGLDTSKEIGFMLYTDGSGGYGYDNPNGTYLLDADGTAGLVAVAKKHNMVLVVPNAPAPGCDGYDNCWYNETGTPNATAKADWARALVNQVYSQYNIERDRVAIGGYSSGAQFTSRWFVPRHGAAVQTDGVFVPIAYGGAPAVTGTFPASYKSAVVGSWDTGTSDAAYSTASYGARGGYNWYTANGFTTDAVWPAGVGHARDGEFDAIMDREVTQHVRAPRAAGTTTTAPAADYWYDPVSGVAPLTVNFTNKSTGATSYLWDFGNGQTSTAASPSHTFSAAGTYAVKLTATNSAGSNSITGTVTVTAPATPPPAGETTLTGFVTGYSYYDNDPPGTAAIAYEDVVPGRTGAGGTGTFTDPLTVAVPAGTLAPGTKVYLPHLERYGIVEDECATSHSAPDGCTADVDVWVDGRDLPEATVDQCMSDLTGDHPYIVNPASGKPVRTGPVCGSSTTTPPPAPTAAVTATATPGDGTAKVTWNATNVPDPATAGVWVQKVDGTAGAWYRELSGSHTFTGLTNGTAQTLEVFVVRDGAGNLAQTSVTTTPKAATAVAYDHSIAPRATGATLTVDIPAGSPRLTWRMSASPITTQTGFYDYTDAKGNDVVLGTSSTLQRNTTYYYQLESGTRSNVVAKGTFKTLP